ncbi:hypothetical protein M8C21_026077 [Ambrosia artemisiifolia]|uniref:Uncharacterized protein n=1 Tax=Ambrosia artemisiifolia TaxID=4212 RepID=A0AAD5BLE1_AMBAR|nr:hypothetical protein M8C21_026077 [Ambrosia artemisiifolia]
MYNDCLCSMANPDLPSRQRQSLYIFSKQRQSLNRDNLVPGKGCKLVACGSVVPKLKFSNDDLSKIVDTADEWISVRIGIRNWRVLQKIVFKVVKKSNPQKVVVHQECYGQECSRFSLHGFAGPVRHQILDIFPAKEHEADHNDGLIALITVHTSYLLNGAVLKINCLMHVFESKPTKIKLRSRDSRERRRPMRERETNLIPSLPFFFQQVMIKSVVVIFFMFKINGRKVISSLVLLRLQEYM